MGTDGEHVFGQVQNIHTENLQEQMEMMIVNSNQQGHNSGTEESRSLVTNGNVPREMNDGDRSRSCLPCVWQCKLHYLPVATFIFIISSMVTCFILAVTLGHVEPVFPYISHTAIEVPESCIFSQTINMGAGLLAANVYIRYKQMMAYLTVIHASTRSRCINTCSIFLGFLSAFGLTIVANFQTNEIQAVHYAGAFLAFTFGLAYCWFQTHLSIRYCKWAVVTVCQISISCILTVCYIIFFISKIVYKVQEHAGLGTKHDTLRAVYLVSTISEWLTAVFIITFLLTFYKDFSNSYLGSLRLTIKNKELVTQQYNSSKEQSPTVGV